MDGVDRDDDGIDDELLGDDADLEAEPDDGDVLTSGDLVAVEDPDGSTELPALPAEAIARPRGFAAASRAASTRAKYEAAWDSFAQWCAAHGHEPLPAHPGTVAVFLAEEAGRGCSPSWVALKMAAIGWAHRRAGKAPPHKAAEGGVAILDVLAGIRREHGRPPERKHAAYGDVVRDVLRAIDGEDLRSVRDRALLAFGLASCLRRSELVALHLDDLTRVPEGLRVHVRRSKTDQEGKGAVIAVPEGLRLRPVARLQEWLERAGIVDGFLFRRLSRAGDRALPAPMSDRAVARGAGACRRRRLRPAALRRTLLARGLPDLGRADRRLRVQDAGAEPAQVDPGALYLRPRRPGLPRPRRQGLPVNLVLR